MGGGGGGGGGLVRWSIMSVVERTNEACMAVTRQRRRWAVREPVPPSKSSAAYEAAKSPSFFIVCVRIQPLLLIVPWLRDSEASSARASE